MIQDAVWTSLLPEHLVETCLAAVIETAISTYLGALDDEDNATAQLYVQKATQAADEAWQAIAGLQGPSVTNPTVPALEHPSSASPDEDSEDMDFSAPPRFCSNFFYFSAPWKSRLSAPQPPSAAFTGNRSNSTLASEEHAPLQRSLAAGCENRRLVPHTRLPQVALPLGRVRLPYQRATESGWWWRTLSMLRLDPLLGHAETCSTAEATRGHTGTASRCRQNRSSADGNMKFKLLFYAGEEP